MRLLFCLNGPNAINGPNVWLTRHLPLLKARGMEPRVLYLTIHPEEHCPFRAALEARGIEVDEVPYGPYTEDRVVALLRAIDTARPDVFVPNYSIPGYFACRFAREAGIRTIGILHSDDPFYHDILDSFVASPEPWRLDGIVAVSDYLHDLALAAATPDTRVLHAAYGAPVSGTRAAAPTDSLTLFYVGRLVEHQKRIHRLVSRLCAATAAVDGVRAVLYGDGSERDEVEAHLRTHGDDRVRLGGALDSARMMEAMTRGHALVLLSDFEGLSIALMEAMACGLVPIVAHTRSGAGDLLEHGVNALVVDPDCPAAFIGAVRRLREEEGLWQRLSDAARAAIIERGYTTEACADRWAAFCHDLAPTGPERKVMIPAPDQIELPKRCTRPYGLRQGDRRDPRPLLLRVAKAGRPVYVWGAGAGGRQFLSSRLARELDVTGVIDRRAKDGAIDLEGLRVHAVDRLAEECERGRRPFVVIASTYKDEIASDLEHLGLAPDVDFIPAPPAIS